MGGFSPQASTADVKLAIFNDDTPAETDRFARRFAHERVLARLRALHKRVTKSGVTSISTTDDPLVALGQAEGENGALVDVLQNDFASSQNIQPENFLPEVIGHRKLLLFASLHVQ